MYSYWFLSCDKCTLVMQVRRDGGGTGALSVLPFQLFCKLTLFPKKRALRIYIYMYESDSHSVMSDSRESHGLYSPWNSSGHNTGVGSLYSYLCSIVMAS